MRTLFLVGTLLALPIVSQAAGNRELHCRSKSAELVFHTVMHGEIALGDYTVLHGQRSEFPKEARYAGREGEALVFYNQNRIFRVENSGADAPLKLILLAQLFGERPTILEEGSCEDASSMAIPSPHQIYLACANEHSELILEGLGPDLTEPTPHHGHFFYRDHAGQEFREDFVYPYTVFHRLEGSPGTYFLPISGFSLPGRQALRLVIEGLYSNAPKYRLEFFYRDFIPLTVGSCQR